MTAINVINPRSGKVDFTFAPPTETEIQHLSAGLREAQTAWWRNGVQHRIEALLAFCAELDKQRDAVIEALCADTGRWALSQMELDGLIGYTHARCSHAEEVLTENFGESSAKDVRFRQHYIPYPVLGVISPWNYPLILSFLDAVPALLAGCAVLIKPSEVTPRFIEPISQVLNAVADLKDVVKVIPGAGETGQQLIAATDAVVFTGSVATGRTVAVAAAQDLKPAFLELGGKDPAIVLNSADLENAAQAVMHCSVVNSGQACFSTERIYVDKRIAPQFIERLCELADEIDIDYPNIKSGHIGPLIFQRQAEIVQAHLDDALSKGAKILTGGKIENHDGGLWLRPTVLVNVDHSMKIMQEETFAPILPVMEFASEDEAVAMANDTSYGLSASVFGEEEDVLRVGARLEAGGVYLNDVDLIGEVGLAAEKNAFKNSGLGGSRYGPDGILRYMRNQALVLRSGSGARIEQLKASE